MAVGAKCAIRALPHAHAYTRNVCVKFNFGPKLTGKTEAEHLQMKGITRGVVWWPGLSADIERKVKDCKQCQQHQKAPAQSPQHPGNGQHNNGPDYTSITLVPS